MKNNKIYHTTIVRNGREEIMYSLGTPIPAGLGEVVSLFLSLNGGSLKKRSNKPKTTKKVVRKTVKKAKRKYTKRNSQFWNKKATAAETKS